MTTTRTQRIPEWTGNSQQDVGATDLPRADDFGYDDDDLGYRGTADPGVWHADSWPMCTRGNPQRLRHPVAYSVDRADFRQIELHVPVSGDERTCNAICQEDLECVRVRVFICCTAHDWDSFTTVEYHLMPMDLYTADELRARRVIDYDTGLELPRRESLWPSRRYVQQLLSSPEETSPTPQPPLAELDITF
ncbi:MAG TPA: hypothetical protein VG223_02370 [Solirubrobacteraceae bacterium]|nr:hypothetical protein [Solirubrobacteraceae bacterium]